MTDPDKLPLYPAWRQAEADLIEQGITEGSLITDEWLDHALDIRPPQTVAAVQRTQLYRLSQVSALRDSLLKNHRMMLRRTEGVGYTVIPAADQTRVAMRDRTDEIKRGLLKLAEEISHVKTETLTDAQRKENSDAIAKLATLRGMVRKQLKHSAED
jgi:hypothetical protein